MGLVGGLMIGLAASLYLLGNGGIMGASGIISGLVDIYKAVPERFDMILEKSNPEYMNLTGIGVLIGGMWVANLYYWGFNQYIIQRTLAAKSLEEGQKGIVFAAFLKLII